MNGHITYYQNYYDTMSLQIKTGNKVSYFQILKKGALCSEMVKPYKVVKAIEIKPKLERGEALESLRFKLIVTVEDNDGGEQQKLLIIEIQNDKIAIIIDKTEIIGRYIHDGERKD